MRLPIVLSTCFVIGGAVCLLAPFSESQASDHIDFPATEEGSSGSTSPSDITDVFAFTSPSGPGRLTLVMNSLSDAGPNGEFSDAVDYVFRLRRAQASEGEGALRTLLPIPLDQGGQELRIVCRYDSAVREMTCETECTGDCTLPSRSVVATIDAEDGGTTCLADAQCDEQPPLKLFAGLRADPFYVDGIAAAGTLRSPGPARDALRARALGLTTPEQLAAPLVMPAPQPTNSLAGKNVLSIVLELDVAAVSGDTSVFAVVGETFVAAAGGE